jgi:hypothetical protein
MSEKFIGYFRLLDACAQGGCPVCRCVRESGHLYLDALIYEHVTDPDTRRRLRASWGFCNMHTWMLLETENSYLGAGIIYEDLLGRLVHRVRRLADRSRVGRFASWLSTLGWRRRGPTIAELYRRRQICPVCASAAAAEDQYLRTLGRFISDPEVVLAYANSDGICAPHALQAIELEAGSPGLPQLLDRTLQKWQSLREDLESFVRKHDYRNREPFTEAEAESYRRAFELLAGAPGLFGNDLHASRRGDGRASPPRRSTVIPVEPRREASPKHER